MYSVALIASLACLPPASGGQTVLMPLARRPGEVMYGDTVAMRSHFVATLRIGTKDVQELDVVFDTSSGQVILPSVKCASFACQDRNLYSLEVTGGTVVKDSPYGPRVETELDMVDFDVGSLNGSLARDSFCFGPTTDFSGKSVDTCLEMNLLAAEKMDDTPYLQLPFDGVVGLGRDPLSISPLFNFVSMWAADTRATVNEFAFYLPPSRQGPGELAFGGHVASRLASPLVWVPVEQADSGFWLVRIKEVRVDSKPFRDACPAAGCYGLIDTGSSRIGVPANAYASMVSALQPSTPKDGDCRRATGPELRLVLGGVADEAASGLVFSGGHYATLVGDRCQPELVALREMPFEHVFVLGETVLRRYYTVFDWEKKRIGFGLAREGSSNKDEL